ncbi:hypothetical protein K474DRAFT_415997 [Panus rudis PR-1116 ss-1]|nr:hypothetical protein K474DRAFT_415997 [Panus rudis PR-1116 ss-1]
MRNSSSMEVLHFNGPSVHYAEPILSMLAQSATTTTAEDTCQSPPSSLHIILGPTTTFDAIKAITAIRSKVGEWYSFGSTQTGIHTRLVEKITFQSPPLNPADADEVLAHAESLVQYGITLRHTPLVSDFTDEDKGSLLGAAQNPFKGAGGDMRVPSGYKLPFI